MKQKTLALILALLTLSMAGCAYETVNPNEAGVLVENGKFSEQVSAGRYNTFTFIGDTTLTKWKTGLSQSVMTGKSNGGDVAGDDSVPITSSEGSTLAADVTVTYRLNPDKVECLYKAGYMTDEAIRDRLIRPEVQAAFATVGSSVNAIELVTTRKGELANIALNYVQERLGQKPIPGNGVKIATPLLDPTEKIQQTHPSSRVADKTACGIEVESVLIPVVIPPENIQNALNASIDTIAETQKIELSKAKAQAEAENAKITNQTAADAAITSANAQAEANRVISNSLSTGLLQLKIAESCERALSNTKASIASCGGASTNNGGSTNLVITPAPQG